MSPAAQNPKRDEMERLMKGGMSRDEAFKQVYKTNPPETATTKNSAGLINTLRGNTENRTQEEIDEDEEMKSKAEIDRFEGVDFASHEARELALSSDNLTKEQILEMEASGASGGYTKADIQELIDSLVDENNSEEVVE